MRALAARAVRAAGHDVVAEVCDAEGALARLATVRPDAIVLDGRIACVSLADLVSRLKTTCGDPAILIVASLRERALVASAIAAGASGALVRPLKSLAVAEQLAKLHGAAKIDS